MHYLYACWNAAVEERVVSRQEAAPNEALYLVFLGRLNISRTWHIGTLAIWCADARCRTHDSRSASRAVAADAHRAVVLGTCPTHLGPAGGCCTSRAGRAEAGCTTVPSWTCC